jgi:hypothetical protein
MLGVVLAASVALNVALLLRGGSDDTPASSTSEAQDSARAQPTGVAAPALKPLPVGATMGIGTLKISVERVFAIEGAPADRTWIGVEGSVENAGLDNFSLVGAQQFVVKDTTGGLYRMSVDAMREARRTGLSKRQEWSADIAPAQVLKGFVAFELPADCRGMTFFVTGLSREANWLLEPVCSPPSVRVQPGAQPHPHLVFRRPPANRPAPSGPSALSLPTASASTALRVHEL